MQKHHQGFFRNLANITCFQFLKNGVLHVTRGTVLFPPGPFPFHKHVCASGDGNEGVSFSFFSVVSGATACACSIEKAPAGCERGKREAGEGGTGVCFKEIKKSFFFPSTWLCKTLRILI